MHVKLPAGVYRLYVAHAGFRMVSGDHVTEDPVSYMHQGARVERHPYFATFDFRTLKELRIGLECDEVLASLITWHRSIWRGAIELLEPSVEEVGEAIQAATQALAHDGIKFGKTIDETRADLKKE